MLPVLKNYDLTSKVTIFNQTSYACSVCLTSVKGAKCILLSCQHVFCRDCLEDFWKLCIAEGGVGRVGCPDPECVKDGREAVEEEVRRVVTEEELTRWKWLREKRMLEKGAPLL
jgi:E3 ubiquitin-protein ligase RNF14